MGSDYVVRLFREAEKAQHARHLAAARMPRPEPRPHTSRQFGLEPRRVSVSRPLPPFDQDAFDVARRVFNETYRRAMERSRTQDEEAHDEATGDALEAFLGSYLEQVTL